MDVQKQETYWTAVIKPIFDYIIRLAEIITLAAVFRVAADRADSLFLEIVSSTFIVIIGGYAGYPVGSMVHKLDKIETKSRLIRLSIPSLTAITVGGLALFIGIEVTEAIRIIADVDSK